MGQGSQMNSKLKRFDPQDVLPRVKAAALAGNKNAQAMLDRISGK